jgi:acetyltransferase-like isoleucine patch superfamily enzyme
LGGIGITYLPRTLIISTRNYPIGRWCWEGGILVKREIKNLTDAEAIKVIEKNNAEFNINLTHMGFVTRGQFPFRMSKIINNVTLWPPVDIHPSAQIGSGCIIGRYTNICGDIKIGNNTRIQGFCYIPDCVEIGECVFIGPNVVFTNVKYPKVRNNMMKHRDGKTVIHNDVNLGAGCVIGPGVEIAKGVTVGMGAVVTKNITEEYSVYIGIPARPFDK